MILKNCSWILTQNPNRDIMNNGDICIEDNKIVDIGIDLGKNDDVIDCSDKAILPGLINSHTHVAMTLFRGFADDMLLQDWLQNKIWPLESKLTEEYVYQGTLLGVLELIKSGTTTFNDMYFFGRGVKNAVEEGGIRAFFSQGVLDNPTAEFQNADQAFKLFKSLLKEKTELFIPTIGTHSPYTCNKETLLKAKEIAKKNKSMIHIHASETRKEVYDSIKVTGKRPIEYLQDIGFLGKEILVAHAGWTTKGEVLLMGNSGAKVSHCPVSNMKLAVGAVAPLPEMFNNHVTVSLGTDSAASNNNLDIFETMKVATLLQKMHRWDARILPAQKTLDMATIDGARSLGMHKSIGSIEVDKNADLIILDIKKPHLYPVHNILSNIVYSANGNDVWGTIVNGEIIMKNRIITRLIEEEVLEKSSTTAYKLSEEL
tara:strand:- start:2836 stop:4122 length:1287 start_codon:yes stop_codon:yes gene_type:complete